MAPLNRWSWLGLGCACLGIALAYLPPRGSPLFRSAGWATGREVDNALREEQRLARAWRQAEARLTLRDARARLEVLLAERTAAGGPSVAMLVAGPDQPDRAARYRPPLDSAWSDLQLVVTKVATGVLLRNPPLSGGGSTPGTGGERIYLLPDTASPGTCVVRIEGMEEVVSGAGRVGPRGQLRYALGPCAWLARFVVPGPRVRAWLWNRRWDVASVPNWHQPPRRSERLGAGLDADLRRWWLAMTYELPPTAVGCLAGRPKDCRRVIAEGDGGGLPAGTAVMAPRPPHGHWLAGVRLVGAEVFLAGVYQAVGDERFAEFWHTTLPVDSALSVALGRPVGEWTAEWQEGIAVRPRLGPSPTTAQVASAFGLAAVAVGLTLTAVRRREVRAG